MRGGPIAITKARAIAIALVFAALFAIGFLPLFGGPGYEHAIASGLLVPTVASIVAALDAFAGKRGLVADRTPLAIVLRGLATGALLATSALLAAWVHVLRVGPCDPIGGTATFLLGPGLGALLAGAAGSVVAIAVGHVFGASKAPRALALWIAGLLPLSTALFDVGLFYATPAVFAFDPFVGFFSGTLYDEVVDAYGPLVTYRAGTLLTLAAIASFSASATWTSGRLTRRMPKLTGLGVLVAGGSMALVALGPTLGHRTSSAFLRASLGGARVGDRCEVVYPATTSDDGAALMLRDCEEEIRAVEARLGARGPERIVAYFFKDASQKRALMGAGDTYIAKPWRKEVYLQVASYPHPVLGHELAHVIAGALAPGPFHVAGKLGGLVPNPGLIEGLAVAASLERDELTPAQWGRAMKELGILPKLSRIFGPGFLGENSSIAYTVAGSFVGHQLDLGRGAAVRAWYAGASFDRAFGRSFADAEAEWRASLEAAPLPDAALIVAKGRFERPAIWGRRCPHVVERLREDGDRCHADGRIDAADAKYAALLRLDPVDPSARMDRARIANERGDVATYVRALEALAEDTRISSNWRARALESLGDQAVREQRLGDAVARYALARTLVVDDDRLRNLDVKAWLAGTPERAARFGRLLVGRLDQRDETMPALLDLARFSATPGDPVDVDFSRYLLARRLYDAHAYDDTRAMLDFDVTVLDAITPRIRREIGRMGVLVACLLPPEGRKARVEAALAAYERAPRGNEGRASEVERIASRCAP